VLNLLELQRLQGRFPYLQKPFVNRPRHDAVVFPINWNAEEQRFFPEPVEKHEHALLEKRAEHTRDLEHLDEDVRGLLENGRCRVFNGMRNLPSNSEHDCFLRSRCF